MPGASGIAAGRLLNAVEQLRKEKNLAAEATKE